MTLKEKFDRVLKEKNSILCVGLDPALPNQRLTKTINRANEDSSENLRLNFCIDILEKTADFCIAAKPNEQYLRGFTTKQHQTLTKVIRKMGLLSIYDCKLGDIKASAESAIYYFKLWGYDAITVNPFPGNLKELVTIAHGNEPHLGLFVLTLMSNPEATKLMKNAMIGNNPVYIEIAKDVKKYSADGCVVGATGHITANDIKRIRSEAGEDKILLIPGVGTQEGDPKKVIQTAGKRILINVGRAIIYSDDPKKKAMEYQKIFSQHKN